ncbi:hypothetical protein [Nocardia sp. NPDC024068]|uniref:hypothetical protein n=1 Tax=Nocardia sp. NPDC024068 TaxID=3157197 RepID=UPI00340A0128
MRFEVRVSCDGARWLITAPAFGVTRIVLDEQAIRKEAILMIAECGTAPKVFEVDLVHVPVPAKRPAKGPGRR